MPPASNPAVAKPTKSTPSARPSIAKKAKKSSTSSANPVEVDSPERIVITSDSEMDPAQPSSSSGVAPEPERIVITSDPEMDPEQPSVDELVAMYSVFDPALSLTERAVRLSWVVKAMFARMTPAETVQALVGLLKGQRGVASKKRATKPDSEVRDNILPTLAMFKGMPGDSLANTLSCLLSQLNYDWIFLTVPQLAILVEYIVAEFYAADVPAV